MELFFHRWSRRVAPDENSPRVLLLHGMGGTGALWRPISATWEEDFDVLAPDQRGHGKSQLVPGQAAAAEFSPIQYGRDLVETLGKINFHPTWVIGHSMGVRSACALAHLQPDWVSGLMLIDLGVAESAGGEISRKLGSFIQKLPNEFPSRKEAREFMDRKCPDRSIAQYLMAVAVVAPDGKVTFPFDHKALIKTVNQAEATPLREWLEEFGKRGMPVLLLRGEKSVVWKKDDFEREKKAFAGYPSISFMEISGAGHGLPFEKRPEFVKAAREFMASHSRRG